MLSVQKTYYHADYLKKSLNSTSIVWLIDVLNEILPVSEIKCGLSIQEKRRGAFYGMVSMGQYVTIEKGNFLNIAPLIYYKLTQ